MTNVIYPPPTYSSRVFIVMAEARVGEIARSVEAVVDRTQPGEPLLLSWRTK